jgi:hypothetical protein
MLTSGTALFLQVNLALASLSDTGVQFPQGWPTPTNALKTNSWYPFLIKQADLTSMRYQQVYDASLFSTLDDNIYSSQVMYLNHLLFSAVSLNPLYPGGTFPWTITNMQVNFSTTAKLANNLSSAFSDNVGPDDQIVFGPSSHTFFASAVGEVPSSYLDIYLDHSFSYDPRQGNLLMDVRVYDGTGIADFWAQPAMECFKSLSGQVSQVWSTNVDSPIAQGADTVGLRTGFAISWSSLLTVPSPVNTQTNTVFPFLIQQTYPKDYPSNVPVSMRYQQVYSSNIFTNLESRMVYVTALAFKLPYGANVTVSDMQIKLSTTSKKPGGLSSTFAENIGPDEALVFGPHGTNQFRPSDPEAPSPVYLSTPFHYDPARGNLLLDISISALSGPCCFDMSQPYLEAFTAPSNLTSRAWSTNVTAALADATDATGLITIFQFSPLPSLQAKFLPTSFEGDTNIIQISWPSQPSVFQLQTVQQIGTNSNWVNVTNEVIGSSQSGGREIQVPRDSAAATSLYRLIWPNGQ